MKSADIEYTAEAERALDQLRDYYQDKGRIEALLNLANVLDAAEHRIAANPAGGVAAPRMYPDLQRRGRAWIEQGGYWINYRMTEPPVIVGVYYGPVIEGLYRD